MTTRIASATGIAMIAFVNPAAVAVIHSAISIDDTTEAISQDANDWSLNDN
jgi:hypothetical protein